MAPSNKRQALLWSLLITFVVMTTWKWLFSDNPTRSAPWLRTIPPEITPPSVWPCLDDDMHKSYLQSIIKRVDSKPLEELAPSVQRLKDAIDSTPRLYMQFTQMFEEVSRGELRGDDEPVVRDYYHLLRVLNQIIKTAPTPGMTLPLPPMASIFASPANTASGWAALLDPEVNRLLKDILSEWASFLQSPESQPYVRNGSYRGWLGSEFISDLERVANLPYGTTTTFAGIFQCDPQDDYYGFNSWDDFFTRRFLPGVRPIADPEDDNVIVNACESVPHTITTKAKLGDLFFIKGQPYSVLDMLGHDPIAYNFSDATVYQAFLSMHSYHRWHAPISGKIHSAYVIDGTYFSLPRALNTDHSRSPCNRPLGFGDAMRYMSEMATRAVIIIKADNPILGLVAFIAVGMVEISTCEIKVKQGQHVQKGDELGSFHLGGSSYCLLFQDGVKLIDLPLTGDFSSPNIAVLSKIAVVSTPKLTTQG